MNNNELDERDYLNDLGYMEYKRSVYKKKRVLDIIAILALISGIILIIIGVIFTFLKNDISYIFYIIGVAMLLYIWGYAAISRIVFSDDSLYIRYKKKNK